MSVFVAEFSRNLYILKRFISTFMTLFQDWRVLEKNIQSRGCVRQNDICDNCICYTFNFSSKNSLVIHLFSIRKYCSAVKHLDPVGFHFHMYLSLQIRFIFQVCWVQMAERGAELMDLRNIGFILKLLSDLDKWWSYSGTLDTRLQWSAEQRWFVLVLYKRKSQAGCCQGKTFMCVDWRKNSKSKFCFPGLLFWQSLLLFILLRNLKQLYKSWVLPAKPVPENDVVEMIKTEYCFISATGFITFFWMSHVIFMAYINFTFTRCMVVKLPTFYFLMTITITSLM